MISSDIFNSSNLYYAGYIIITGQFFDCFITLWLIENYSATEFNPLMKALIDFSPLAFIVLKTISAFVLVFMIAVIKNRSYKWARITSLIVIFLSIVPPVSSIVLNS